MLLSELQQRYAAHPNVEGLCRVLGDAAVRHVHCRGLCGSVASLFSSAVVQRVRSPFVFVLGDLEEAGYFYHDLTQILGTEQVLFFPSSYRRAIKYGQKDPANEILRTEVLSRLRSLSPLPPSPLGRGSDADNVGTHPDASYGRTNSEGGSKTQLRTHQGASLQSNHIVPLPTGEGQGERLFCIVTYPDALAERVVSQKELGANTLSLRVGEAVDMGFVTEALRSYGFEQVDYVYEPGQYALRGSIIDVFSYSSEYPFRIDFFGDEVESLRIFEVETQLSKEKREEVSIIAPLNNVGTHPDASYGRTKGEGGSKTQLRTHQGASLQVDEGVPIQSQECSFFDYLPEDTVLAVKDLFWVNERIRQVCEELLETDIVGTHPDASYGRTNGEGGSKALLRTHQGASLQVDGEGTKGCDPAFSRFRLIEFGNKPTGTPQAVLTFNASVQPIFHKEFDLVARSFKEYLAQGYAIYICSDSQKQTERIRAIFDDRGDDIEFTAVERTLHEGFTDHTLRLCIFTDHQLFDRFHKYSLRSDKARSGKVALSLKELNQFTPGDYVVHTDHGIGRFAGLVRLPVGDTTQEVMKLVYQNEDVVFVSIHSLHKVSKYKGKEGEAPRLNKLGTGAWEKLKNRTKAKIKDIARDLILLYSKRKQEQGFAFSPDSFMQHELEASFLYEDTPDQGKATADVKADMESPRPMDRLICGDVGFGKTEVAIRAAFKAVADNKQVAVLVPTTVLAFQHYQTFTERLKGMPCRVEYLSRARTAKQAKDIIKGLESGEVNILIGTHRILGKDVKFHDLGLLIVDEEQKFGVSVKEKLRQMKVNVDTLTLTATPIPRTLQFSLMGARDLSVIQTPPPNRYPIQTEVHPFGEEVIADAVNFEMSRNGQVFFVNNRISNLASLKEMIVRLVPDCRVCIGHGQMEPAELEKIIFDFVNYDYDVLLSTTIVENGVDIPNANTIIVNGAQNFGLSDLHQMRGRVGRSNKKAFCYLLAPPLASLPNEARRRLQAIENFSDLGSGIHIAMQDLDIRGAGNLLGAEQSGFIADLGYETYQKILGEAVHELKEELVAPLYQGNEATRRQGDKASSPTIQRSLVTLSPAEDCTIESDLELLLPADYVAGSGERMSLYRELDSLTSERQVQEFRARLEDRFGPVPPETEELLRIPSLRRLAAGLGVEKLFLKGGQMTLFFPSRMDSPYYQSDLFGRFIAYMMRHTRRCDLSEKNGRRTMHVRQVASVSEALSILQEISTLEPNP